MRDNDLRDCGIGRKQAMDKAAPQLKATNLYVGPLWPATDLTGLRAYSRAWSLIYEQGISSP